MTDNKTTIFSNEDKDLLKRLRVATKGLTFMSESDKPVKAFLWEAADKKPAAVSVATLQALGKVPDGATVKKLSAETFFDPVMNEKPWFDDTQKIQAKQFTALLEELKAQLPGLTAFRIEMEGEAVVPVFVIGETKSGNLAGVQTELVET